MTESNALLQVQGLSIEVLPGKHSATGTASPGTEYFLQPEGR